MSILFFSACTNNDSSTVASQDEEQTTAGSSQGHGKEISKPLRDQTETKKMKEGSINAVKDTAHSVQH